MKHSKKIFNFQRRENYLLMINISGKASLASNSVWNSVEDSVERSVWDSVWDSVGDSVRESVREFCAKGN